MSANTEPEKPKKTTEDVYRYYDKLLRQIRRALIPDGDIDRATPEVRRAIEIIEHEIG